MTMGVLKNGNAKAEFHYKGNKYPTARLKRLLCNALIQSHFDYKCISRTFLLNDDDELFLWYG